MTVTPLVAGLLACASVGVGLLAVPMLLDRGPIDRLSERTGGRVRRQRRSLLRNGVESLAAVLGPRLAPRLRTRQREALTRRLDLAGRPAGLSVQRFVGLKAALATVLGGLLGLLALTGSPAVLVLMAAGVGWFAPDVRLVRAGRMRQERIDRGLPDFLDILAVTVRAGLGYRQALRRVAESIGGPVSEEVLVALRQMDLGASRRAAFLALRDRNDSDALRSLVAAQLQAEELGVPLSEALNDIAADLRRGAHQAARQRAQRAAPRVSLVVTSLVLPATMLLVVTAILLSSGVLESGIL